MFLKERREGYCVMLKTPKKIQELQRKLYQGVKLRENLWKKMMAKPYSGKPNERFDGDLEIEPQQPLPQLSTLLNLVKVRKIH